MIKNLFKRIVLIIVTVSIILFISFIMLRYNVEGEKNLPFSISKILIVSTVDGQVNDDKQNVWNVNIEQVNDIYIYLDKTIQDEQTIKEIKLENFSLVKEPKKGNIKLLRPTGDLSNLYSYSQQDYFSSSLTYTGGKIDDLKSLEISNDGGVIAFRLSLTDLGNFISNDVQEISYDGSLISGLGISFEEIQFSINFDIIITTSENINFKSTINLDFPLENIIKNGTDSKEISNFEDLVFKRIQYNKNT